MENKEEIEELCRQSLEKIRPYIQYDGGDVEFVRLEDDGTVVVRMLGACAGCMAIGTTLTDGVEAILRDEVPGITRVVLDSEPMSYEQSVYTNDEFL